MGHASTGKSGRVIERLQQEIDKLNREKRLLKVRHEEAEKANETLTTRNQYLQDRNSNYESSHEASARQLLRKERQVEDLREELRKERVKTVRAEEAAQAAAASEDVWREQAHHAKSIAQQKEAEYDAIVACRTMDNERHQTGLDKIRNSLDSFLRQHEEDLDKQKKLEIIAEQQKKTIEQMDELGKKLTANFRAYRAEIDSAIAELRETTSSHDIAVYDKLEEMRKTTGEMRWVMNVEKVVNHKEIPPKPSSTNAEEEIPPSTKEEQVEARPSSPTKKISIDFRRHRRKGSKPAPK